MGLKSFKINQIYINSVLCSGPQLSRQKKQPRGLRKRLTAKGSTLRQKGKDLRRMAKGGFLFCRKSFPFCRKVVLFAVSLFLLPRGYFFCCGVISFAVVVVGYCSSEILISKLRQHHGALL